MQYLMVKHKNVTVSQIANQASQAADIEGITGFMYGCATNILSQVWKHGDELREWHNKKYGYAGKGIANTALLTVNVK